jgi:hypothetical protein
MSHWLSYYLNAVIRLLKWPIAALALWNLPWAAGTLWRICLDIASYPRAYQALYFGMGAYLLAWFLGWHRYRSGNWFSTLEHELTHALFAVLSFNSVKALNATGEHGGQVQISGPGNWLISIAPYFFPTLSVAVVLTMSIAERHFQATLSGLLGYTVLYHLHSTWKETHREQSDLRKTGFLFAWLFLPGANILMLLWTLAYLPNDRWQPDDISLSLWRHTVSAGPKLYQTLSHINPF